MICWDLSSTTTPGSNVTKATLKVNLEIPNHFFGRKKTLGSLWRWIFCCFGWESISSLDSSFLGFGKQYSNESLNAYNYEIFGASQGLDILFLEKYVQYCFFQHHVVDVFHLLFILMEQFHYYICNGSCQNTATTWRLSLGSLYTKKMYMIYPLTSQGFGNIGLLKLGMVIIWSPHL